MIFQGLANSQLFLHWYPAGLHFSFCRSSKGLVIVYTTVKLNWHGEDFYGTFTKKRKKEKQWKVWSLSLVCGTQAHKTFHLVELSHHFVIVYITFPACYKTLGSFFFK